MMPLEPASILLERAADDQAAVEELLTSSRVSDRILGFHCQQAVEKLMKALLAHLHVHYEKTHNLRYLMSLLAANEHPLPEEFQNLDRLSPFAVLLRYGPPSEPGPLDRQQALASVRRLRAWVEPQIRTQLGQLAGISIEEAEKELIRNTLKMVGGNREQAANILGIGERTLYRKIKEYGLKE